MILTHRLRRGVATAAIAGAAILLPAVALASSAGTSAHSTAARSAAAPRCVRGYLTSWLGFPGSGAAGSSYYELEISNVSGQTCTLYGFPGVSARGSGGRQLGSAALRSPGYSELTVTLAPYQTAHVVLQITDTGNFSPSACRPATAGSLRVYAPGDYTPITVPFSFSACAAKGPIFLHVSPTLAGTGIPGYSS
ncbi:MAG: DUF4232 domain-containing protein [Streptosporangiaceae bacterium]